MFSPAAKSRMFCKAELILSSSYSSPCLLMLREAKDCFQVCGYAHEGLVSGTTGPRHGHGEGMLVPQP